MRQVSKILKYLAAVSLSGRCLHASAYAGVHDEISLFSEMSSGGTNGTILDDHRLIGIGIFLLTLFLGMNVGNRDADQWISRIWMTPWMDAALTAWGSPFTGLPPRNSSLCFLCLS